MESSKAGANSIYNGLHSPIASEKTAPYSDFCCHGAVTDHKP